VGRQEEPTAVTTFAPISPTTPTPTVAPCPTPAESHAMHLGVDLQVDTLLFTLAAAVSAAHEEAPEPPVPWRRWLTEDIEAALVLAVDTLRRKGSLPSSLAAGRTGSVLADLVARYSALVDLVDGATTGPQPCGDVLAVRDRYAARLRELVRHTGPADDLPIEEEVSFHVRATGVPRPG